MLRTRTLGPPICYFSNNLGGFIAVSIQVRLVSWKKKIIGLSSNSVPIDRGNDSLGDKTRDLAERNIWNVPTYELSQGSTENLCALEVIDCTVVVMCIKNIYHAYC